MLVQLAGQYIIFLLLQCIAVFHFDAPRLLLRFRKYFRQSVTGFFSLNTAPF